MPDGTVWVAFSCYRDGRAEIWSLYRQAGVWHSSGPVSGNERRAYRPAIGAGRGGRPVVAWQSFDSGDGEIHASEFDGAGWSAPVAVGADSGLDVQPAMATDCEGKLWVTWMSDRTGNWDVYACYQDAGGWTQAQAVEPAPGPDMNPVIAGAPAGEVWVAWQGLSTNWDIFARSVPLSGSREPGSGQAGVWRGPGVGRGEIDVALPGLEHVQFVDGTGRVLTTTAAHGGRVHWDAPAPGVYFCRAVTRTGPLVRKVVVVR